MAQAEPILHGAYASFEAARRAFPDAMGDCDILVTSAAPGEAPKGLDWTGDPAFNFI